MRTIAYISASIAFCLYAATAQATLKPGDAAPNFTVQAAQAGKDFSFSLAESLKKGPVVVYFYPKSFTRGCTIEAHEFAEHSSDFAAAGASLIGLSGDSIDIQREFSAKECRDKFPVGADPKLDVVNAYDARREKPGQNGEALADRVSYVVTPDGHVAYVFVGSDPVKHIENTLEFVRNWAIAKK